MQWSYSERIRIAGKRRWRDGRYSYRDNEAVLTALPLELVGILSQNKRLKDPCVQNANHGLGMDRLRKLGCVTRLSRNRLSYAKKLKGNAGKPFTWETLSFQEVSLIWYLGQIPKQSVLVRDIRLMDFSSLVNGNCYSPFGNQAYQNFRWLEFGMFVF